MSGMPPDIVVTSSDRRDYKLWEGKGHLVTHIGHIIDHCNAMLMRFKSPECLIIHDNTGGLGEENICTYIKIYIIFSFLTQ